MQKWLLDWTVPVQVQDSERSTKRFLLSESLWSLSDLKWVSTLYLRHQPEIWYWLGAASPDPTLTGKICWHGLLGSSLLLCVLNLTVGLS